jgi:two-component system sensor histidine kinase KdpD
LEGRLRLPGRQAEEQEAMGHDATTPRGSAAAPDPGQRPDRARRPLSWRSAPGALARSWPGGYALALLIVLGLTALLRSIHPPLHSATIQLLYLLAVLLLATLAGLGPALATALLSFLCVNYFFVEPRHTFRIDNPQDLARLLEFLGAALTAGLLAGRARAGADQAQRHVSEMLRLYQLSQQLDAEPALDGRVALIAQATGELLAAPFVSIVATGFDGRFRTQVSWGQRAQAARLVEHVLETRDHQLGRLQLGLARSRRGGDHAYLLSLLKALLEHTLERWHLGEMAAQAQIATEADRLKSAILSSLSHDVRTPLAAIRGAASELRATDVDWSQAARQQFLETISAQTERLYQLLSNLLELSRIQAGALKVRCDWSPLDEIIQRVLATLQPRLAERVVQLALPPELPLLWLDWTVTEQVLTNLIENALKYTPQRSPLAVSVTPDGAGWLVRVADQGPGIPPAARERIFEPFQRLGPAPDSTSSGLGLAICRGLLAAQGGRLWVEEAPGGGAVFCFTIAGHEGGATAHE